MVTGVRAPAVPVATGATVIAAVAPLAVATVGLPELAARSARRGPVTAAESAIGTAAAGRRPPCPVATWAPVVPAVITAEVTARRTVTATEPAIGTALAAVGRTITAAAGRAAVIPALAAAEVPARAVSAAEAAV
jgi:hypothetical protein